MRGVTRFIGLPTIFVAFFYIAPAHAQATRTWISGVGDDANPCSRTAPCKTFTGAISKTATGGEIDCLDPGGFGAVTITNSITLDCGGGIGGQVGSILVTGTNGITINAAAGAQIILRNMTINGLAQSGSAGISGVNFTTGASVIIEHVGIFGFGGSGGAGVNFVPSAAGGKLIMRDVEIENNSGDGIYIAPASGVAATATLDNVDAIGNGTDGLEATDGASVTVRNGTFSENASKGLFAKSTSVAVTLNIVGTTSSENTGQGIVSDGASATVTLTGVSIFDNATGIQSAASGKVLSFGNNYNNGNGTNGAPTGTLSPQ